MRTFKNILLGLSILIVLGAAAPHLLRFAGVELPSSPEGAPFRELSTHMMDRIARMDWAFLAHLVGGSLALVLGPFQFWERLRKRRPQVHRRLGYGYFFSIALGGFGGLICAPSSWAGLPAQLGFGGLALAWLSSAALGLGAIRKGRIERHRSFMRLSYALTLAAVSLRIQMPLLFLAGLEELQVYRTVAWSCWVPQGIWWLFWDKTTVPSKG
jgi:hypothetical protein